MSEPSVPVSPVQSKPLEAPHVEGENIDIDPIELLKSGKRVAKAIKRFVKLNPTQLYEKDSNKCLRFESWQFAGACMGYTAMVTQTEEMLTDHGDKLGFIAMCSVINRAGRVVSGAAASCSRMEDYWSKLPEFQLRSMAQTRCCGKGMRLVLSWVMQLAGFSPTPAEEMGAEFAEEKREITTPCYECGNKVSKKLAAQTRKKYRKELCLECRKKADEQFTNTANDPKFVESSIAAVQQKKANGGAQPAIELLDKASFSI